MTVTVMRFLAGTEMKINRWSEINPAPDNFIPVRGMLVELRDSCGSTSILEDPGKPGRLS